MSKKKREQFFNLILAVVVFLLYLGNKTARVFYSLPLEFGRNHLNDTLAGLLWPCYLNIILLFTKSGFKLSSMVTILATSLAAGLFWEYVVPLTLQHGTSDPLDVVCYLLGSFAYYLIYSKVSTAFGFR